MAEHANVVNRADALMRQDGNAVGGKRRRSFVAASVSKVVTAITPPVVDLDEDLPVLTDIVPIEADVAKNKKEHFDEEQVDILASEIAHAIGQQLTFELPMLFEAILINANDELRTGIADTMEIALRDFLARRKQLRLPLE